MRPQYRLTDAAGLAANRQGRLARAQRGVLLDVLRWGAGMEFFSWGCILTPLAVIGLAIGLELIVPALVDRYFSPYAVAWWVLLAAGAAAAIVHNHWPVWRDLRAGRVAQTTGWIVEHGGAYIPYVPEQHLRFLDIQSGLSAQDIESLGPGTYRFYYLPNTRWIVAADPLAADAAAPLAPVSPTETATQIQQALDRAFGSGPADRAANDSGRLTPGQAARCARGAAVQAALWLVGTGVMVSVVLDALGGGDWVFGLLIALFWGAVVFFLLADARKLLIDLAGRSVRAVEGRVTKRSIAGSGGNRRNPRWFYDVGDSELEVDQSRFIALVEGPAYRVYYLPRIRTVVGVTLVHLPPPTAAST